MERCLDTVKDWVIDPRYRLGADVRVVAKDIMEEGEILLHLTAYAVQEIHDPKVPSKKTNFFPAEKPARSRCGMRVAICGFPVNSNHILEWIH